jgi:hypothetical protein
MRLTRKARYGAVVKKITPSLPAPRQAIPPFEKKFLAGQAVLAKQVPPKAVLMRWEGGF